MSDEREQKNAIFGGNVGETPQQNAGPSPMPNPVTRQHNELMMEVPTELVPLPSSGKTYPAGSPLANKDTLTIRSMTTREEDILTSRALIKQGTVITHLLQSCVVDKSINPLDMLAGDRNALMMAIRITGYGEDYPAEIVCGNADCAVKKERRFNLLNIAIKRLEIEPTQPNTNSFQFKLPKSGHVVNFKFLTGNDEEEIAKTQERMKKNGVIADNLVTTRLMYAILSVNNVSDRTKISQFIRNMAARDSRDLRNFIDANEPGVDMKQKTICDVCNHEEEVTIPLGINFFWPSS